MKRPSDGFDAMDGPFPYLIQFGPFLGIRIKNQILVQDKDTI